MRSIRYHPDAKEEFLHQVRYYAGISAGLGERFDRAIQAAEVRAAEFPDMGSPYRHGTRRVFTKKFRFSLVYLHTDTEVLVLAIAPFRKDPNYWNARKG